MIEKVAIGIGVIAVFAIVMLMVGFQEVHTWIFWVIAAMVALWVLGTRIRSERGAARLERERLEQERLEREELDLNDPE